MPAKLCLKLPPETNAVLEALADERSTDPAKIVHQWVRGWLFDRPNPMASSLAAQASALLQRGSLPLLSGGKVTKAELEAKLPAYRFPEGPSAVEDGWLPVDVSSRLADVLPRTVAYADLTMAPADRARKEWADLGSWALELVIGRCAEEGAALDAKQSEDEERALYPDRKKR